MARWTFKVVREEEDPAGGEVEATRAKDHERWKGN